MPNLVLFVLSLPAFASSVRGEESKQSIGQLKFFLNSRDCFEENSSASLRHFLLAMTIETSGNSFLGKAVMVHEQVPNTNIKFICPGFKEKVLYAEPNLFMNFGPTPTQSYFDISF
jgi:hypothetical protein